MMQAIFSPFPIHLALCDAFPNNHQIKASCIPELAPYLNTMAGQNACAPGLDTENFGISGILGYI